MIFKKCKTGRGKTKLWVTNQVSYLSQVDQIIFMKDGAISEHGKYTDLMDKKGMLYDFVQQATHEINFTNKENSDVSDGRFLEEQKDITGHIPMDMSEGKVTYVRLAFMVTISALVYMEKY